MLSVEGLFTTPYNRAQPTDGDLGTFESLGPLGSPAKTETTSGKSLREHLDSGPLIKDVRHRIKFVWYTRVSFTASSRERRLPRSCTCCRMQFPKSHQKGTLRDYRTTSERLQQQVQQQVLCCCVWASAWKCSDQHPVHTWWTLHPALALVSTYIIASSWALLSPSSTETCLQQREQITEKKNQTEPKNDSSKMIRKENCREKNKNQTATNWSNVSRREKLNMLHQVKTALFWVQLSGTRTSLALSLGYYHRVNGFQYALFCFSPKMCWGSSWSCGFVQL